MKPKQDIQKDEMTELAWKELIQAIKPRDISVSVINGSVKLSGTVENYSKKILAEQIVASVTGVKSIVNTIEVLLNGADKRKDQELTDSILDAFTTDFNEREDAFAMSIENDCLTIMGEVQNSLGEMISVKGKLCRLEEISTKTSRALNHPAVITSSELAYWEIFG